MHALRPSEPGGPSAGLWGGGRLRPSSAASRIDGCRVLVLVHGFNCTMDTVRELYAAIADTFRRRLPAAYDDLMGYTWPGGHMRLHYFSAKARAAEAARRLSLHLSALGAAGYTVDVGCHSMGARIALRALEALGPHRVRNVFAVGAAVGGRELEAALPAARHVYVFHTRSDNVLGRWYRLFEWETPLGYAGLGAPEAAGAGGPANVTAVDCDGAVWGHHGYHASEAFLDFLAAELACPSGRRSVRLVAQPRPRPNAEPSTHPRATASRPSAPSPLCAALPAMS